MLLVLLVACSQPVPAPDQVKPFVGQANAIHPSQKEIEVSREDQAMQLVRAFVENQDHDDVDGFLASLKKNKEISTGFMRDLIQAEEDIFIEKKKIAEEWMSLYEKGTDAVSESELKSAQEYINDNIKPILEMNLRNEIKRVKIMNGDTPGFQVKVVMTEIANLPDRKGRRDKEEIYYVADKGGELSVYDISIDEQLMSGMSLRTFSFMLEKDVAKMNEALDWWRRTVGLAT